MSNQRSHPGEGIIEHKFRVRLGKAEGTVTVMWRPISLPGKYGVFSRYVILTRKRDGREVFVRNPFARPLLHKGGKPNE